MILRHRTFSFVLFATLLLAAVCVAPGAFAASPYSGTWSFVVAGDDSGTGQAIVDEDGNISGGGRTPGGQITVTGTVSDSGEFTFTATAGDVSSGATFVGSVKNDGTASGTWTNSFASLRGTWTARRTSELTTTTSSTVAPGNAGPLDPRIAVFTTDGWKYRSEGSAILCRIEHPLNPWTWNNLDYGIRFSWTKTGGFKLETQNYIDETYKSYAYLQFRVAGVKGVGSYGGSAAKGSSVIDVSGPFDNKRRLTRGKLGNIRVKLTDQSVPYKLAIGRIDFSSPTALGYCTFRLQA